MDVIEGEPNYGSITRAHKQTIKNALKVKSIFGGGTTGHVGMVTKQEKFLKRRGTIEWKVPVSKGMYPIFPAGATPERKRQIAGEHVRTEEYILTAEVTEKLLQNQLLKAVDDDYLCALKDPLIDYEQYTTLQLYEYLYENYGVLGLKE